MTFDLPERARELGEWLRGRETLCRRNEAEQPDQPAFADNAESYKFRADTLEIILADNARLRTERSAAWSAGYDAAVGDCAANLTVDLLPDIEEAVCAVVRKRINLMASKP